MKDDYTLWLFQRIHFLDLTSLIIWSYRIGVISSRLSGHSTLEQGLCDGSVHQGVSQVTMFICCHLWRPGPTVIQSLTWGILSEKILNKRKDGRGSSLEMIWANLDSVFILRASNIHRLLQNIHNVSHRFSDQSSGNSIHSLDLVSRHWGVKIMMKCLYNFSLGSLADFRQSYSPRYRVAI